MNPSYFEQLHADMLQELQEIRNAHENPAHWSARSIPFVRQCLADLKRHVLENPFERRSEEIVFFKRMKPAIVCQLIFLTEVFNWWNDRNTEPVREKQRRYWEEKREFIRDYFRKHVVLFNYMINDDCYRDVNFFVCGQTDSFYYFGIADELDPVSFLDDPEFSTIYDHRVAMLIAYKMLDEFCRDQILIKGRVQLVSEGGDTSQQGYELLPLLRKYDSMYSCANISGPITRKEIGLLLHRFMRVIVGGASFPKIIERYKSNNVLSKMVRKEIEYFRTLWESENTDVVYDSSPPEAEIG